VASCDPDDVIVNQIPLLVETGGKDRFDYIISITAPLELRRERCIARGMKFYEFEKRVAAQASDEERAAISNHVIDNTGDADALLRAIEELWESELKPRAIA
jgi:dephospho-CoA kinase